MKVQAPFKIEYKQVVCRGFGWRGWSWYLFDYSRCSECKELIDDGMDICHACYHKELVWLNQ